MNDHRSTPTPPRTAPPRLPGWGTAEGGEAAAAPLVLVVDGDPEAAALAARTLRDHGLAVELAGDTAEMDRSMERRRPDLVVLDAGLPHEDRLATCLRLRDGGPPVILVSVRGGDVDRIIGLDMGAADCLSNPFNPRELVARIRAVLRRVPRGPRPAETARWRFAGWTLDAAARRLTGPAGDAVSLTSAEFDMLLAFCRHPGQTLSRGHLRDLVQGVGSAAQQRSIDLAVRRLRVKIEPNRSNPTIIQTVRSCGYILSVPLQAVP